MNPQQRIAHSLPCLLAIETMNPRYRTVRGAWSEIITINTGHE